MITPPVRPHQGIRQPDAWGAGGFGAPRKRSNGERYRHPGIDLIGKLMNEVVSPMTGVCVRLGRAYPDERPNEVDPSDLGSIHILGRDAWDGFRAKILYVKPASDMYLSKTVHRGHLIGTVQDRAELARVRNPNKGSMTNHIHLSLYYTEDGINWTIIDPTPLLDLEGRLDVGMARRCNVSAW